MKKTFLSFLWLPLVISNISSSGVYSHVQNEVSGDNATVKTQITNNINGQETNIEVNQPGSVKVEVNNGKVEIKISPSVSSVIIREAGSVKGEVVEQKTLRLEIEIWVNNLFTRISKLFNLGS